MASQAPANMLDILKEVWPPGRLARQFYDGTPWIDDLYKTSEYTDDLGKQANVPMQTGLGGGDTVLSSAGGVLNPVDSEPTKKAVFNLAYDWRQISIEFGALNQANANKMAAAVEAKSLEVESKVLACNMSLQRQFLSDGSALIQKCGVTTAANVVVLDTVDGSNVIQRNFLRKGQTIDGGSTANETLRFADRQITAVNKATPSITINGAVVTTAATDFISIANARAGAVSNESMGLLGIAGSPALVVGTLDPATETYWQPASVDSTSTVMTTDVVLDLQASVQQETGQSPSDVLTSFKQIKNLYKQLQVQERYTGDLVKAGSYMALDWAGMKIRAYQPVLDRLWFFYNPADLLLAHGKYSGPTWASSVQGANQGMLYAQGTTAFGDALVCAVGLACRQRRTSGAATALTS